MNNSQNWLEKYKPTKLSEILGDKGQIKAVENFFRQFSADDPTKICNPNLIISGTNGVGKSLIIDIVIQDFGYEKIVADLTNISVARKSKRKKKSEKEVIGNNRSVRTYYTYLKNGKKIMANGEYVEKKVVLVIDDVSNISNSKEKEAIKSIIKHNNKYKYIPIIIITNTKHSKTINELRKMVTYIIKKTCDGKKESKKITNEVIIRSPQYDDMEKFVKKICILEKIKILPKKSDELDVYVELIDHAQYDVRRLINILEELKLIYKDNPISLKELHQYQEISKTKDLDPGIYEATKLLLNSYTNVNTALLLYSEDRPTIPLMVHENYPLNICQQYPKMSVDDQVDLMFDISKSISESDKVDGLIYSNQCWNLQSVHGFYSCVMPSYYINKTPGKMARCEKYRYTQDYNKTSIKKINNKIIKKAQEHPFFKKISIYDFLYIASILKTLLDNKDLEKVAELMKPYNLTLKEIESIIKIDKIKKPKSTLTGKQKTSLKELLNVTE